MHKQLVNRIDNTAITDLEFDIVKVEASTFTVWLGTYVCPKYVEELNFVASSAS